MSRDPSFSAADAAVRSRTTPFAARHTGPRCVPLPQSRAPWEFDAGSSCCCRRRRRRRRRMGKP